jgi:hypothetical protein
MLIRMAKTYCSGSAEIQMTQNAAEQTLPNTCDVFV